MFLQIQIFDANRKEKVWVDDQQNTLEKYFQIKRFVIKLAKFWKRIAKIM